MANETLDDGALALAHYRRIAELSEHLSRSGCTFYRHQYDYLAFGSWQLVAGTRKRQFRFTWDGKDRNLDVEVGIVQSGRVVSWSRSGVTASQSAADDPLERVQAILDDGVQRD